MHTSTTTKSTATKVVLLRNSQQRQYRPPRTDTPSYQRKRHPVEPTEFPNFLQARLKPLQNLNHHKCHPACCKESSQQTWQSKSTRIQEWCRNAKWLERVVRYRIVKRRRAIAQPCSIMLICTYPLLNIHALSLSMHVCSNFVFNERHTAKHRYSADDDDLI
jgi:hypothetical protein